MPDVGTLPIVMIAAVARNGAIGRDNKLLWRLKSDMAHFRARTMGRPVLMGRKTWDSIGRPLPGREIVVVTREAAFAAAGVHVAHDIDTALALAGDIAARLAASEIVVAGGGEIYSALMARAARLAITEVDLAPEADAVFPPIDPDVWAETAREAHAAAAGDEAAFAFVDYTRR